MTPMPSPFEQLLDATVAHVQNLKEQGVRHLAVAPETLAALASAAPVPLRPQSVPPSASAPLVPVRAPSPENPIPFPTRLAAAPPAPPVPPAAPRVTLDPQAKAVAIHELRERASTCIKCANLASTRTTVVFGVGDIHASLMFVGEAPGADEDLQGEPFVGAAGQLLTRILQTMGLSRETVYIANILKCRPDTPDKTSGNRKPTTAEMQTCLPYLHEQIDLIQPRVLVALGATAVEGLLGKTEGITRLRGKWQTYRGIPLMPTFHPSYLLRTQALGDKRKVWEDMLAAMEHLGLPISEKQRGYFLKG
jgi:uracil-DNA glycosylase